jgi:uncharacterized secreted protein with C-terminal beta-propeller domain
MIAYMNKIVDENFEKALNESCDDFGPVEFYPIYYACDGYSDGSISAPEFSPIISDPPNPDQNSGAAEFSETNNQVAGVDEADFIKNNGSHIFMLVDSRFIIIKAWPPNEAHVITEFEIEGNPKKLFVHNKRAVIYSSLDNQVDDSYNGYYSNKKECTYGYDCQFTGDKKELKITILDISDLYQPALARELYFKGSYINSRRIDQSVYTIILFPEAFIKGLRFDVGSDLCEMKYSFPDDWWYFGDWWYYDNPDPTLFYWYMEKKYSDAQLAEMFETIKENNRKLIQDADVSDIFPKVRDVRYFEGQPVTQQIPLAVLNDLHFSNQKDGMNLLTIFSFDINEIASQHSVSVVGKPGAVYASSSACYVALRHSKRNMPWFMFDSWGFAEEATTIHKFALKQSPGASTYLGSGLVKGRVLNQFAMDEHQNFFRIATTSGYLPNPSTHSTLSVLKTTASGDLETVGKIDNIAPTEDIRSVRFNGDKGFIVTFKKTDPLFVLDLSVPEDPKISGELKIPGYSTYMHLMDQDHLLSIGYDSEDYGDFAYFQGVMLQIFDVSDAPKLIHKEVIGTRGSSSESATNHLAFNFFRPKNLLAIPMAICEESNGGGSYGDVMSFNGLMIYKTTIEDGFNYLGGVDHEIQSSCNNWWTNSNSAVQRSIFMDDYVFSVAEDEIQVGIISHQNVENIAVIELKE